MRKLLFYLLAVQFIASCSSNPEKKLAGRWVCISNNNGLIYDFKPNHTLTINFDNLFTLNGTYTLVPNTDSLLVFTQDTQSPIRFTYKFRGSLLFLVAYKNFQNQIDEVFILSRSGIKVVNTDTSHQKDISTIILPPKYIGAVYINYNQQTGQPKEFGVQGGAIIHVPSNGVLKTQLSANPIGYIEGSFSFREKTNGLARNVKQLKFFNFNKYTGELDKLINQGFNLDSVYVCIYGYNQTSREEINKVFGEPIKDNVLMFRVDTLKNLIHNPYYNISLDTKQ